MSAQSRGRVVLYTLVAMLCAAAVGYWYWLNMPRAGDDSAVQQIAAGPAASTGTPGTSGNAPAAAPAQPNVPPFVQARMDPPPPSDFVSLAFDATGLMAHSNYEISDTCGRTVQALCSLAGTDLSCLEYTTWLAALTRRKVAGVTYTALPHEKAAQIGREIQTGKVLQVGTVTSTETKGTVAKARITDCASGQVTSQWEITIPQSPSYDVVFDAHFAIAPLVAAQFCNAADVPALINRIRARQQSQTEREKAKEEAAAAQQLLTTLSTLRLLQAIRGSLAAIERDPACTEAWVTLALAFDAIADQLAQLETPIWRDAITRSNVAGEIAVMLAPDEPHARIARIIGTATAGRYARAMTLADAELTSSPENALARACRALLRQNKSDFPSPDAIAPADRSIYEYLARSMEKVGSVEPVSKTFESWLQKERFSPGLWLAWGALLNGSGRIGVQRVANNTAAFQGSLMHLQEIVRQLELAGNAAEAKELSQRTLPLVSRVACGDGASTGTPSPLAECLAHEFEEWAAKSRGGEMDKLFPALKLCSEWQKRADKVLSQTLVGLRPGSGAMGMTPRDWISLAGRFALDGGAEHFVDMSQRLGSESYLKMGEELAALFPDDLAVLDSLARYYYNYRFDNRKVDEYHRRMRRVEIHYGPMMRRTAQWKLGTTKERTTAYEKLKYGHPFHSPTLSFAADKLNDMQNYKAAAAMYDLIYERYPLNYNAKLNALFSRALAENRFVTEAEVAELAALLPADYSNRDLLLGNGYRTARNVQKALEHFRIVIANPETRASDPHYRCAYLEELAGNTTGAVEAMETYVRKDPQSLATCNALLYTSRIYERHGDMDAATKTWARAAQVDNWQGGVIARGAWLAWRRGDVVATLSEYKRMHERYPGSSADYGFALLATGKEAEALTHATSVSTINDSNEDGYGLAATILRRRNQAAEAVALLQRFDNRMVHDPDPQILFALHYWLMGNMKEAQARAQEAVRRAEGNSSLDGALSILAQYAIEAGDFPTAEKTIHKYRIRNPVEVSADILMSRLLLAKGDAGAALKSLEIPLRAPGEDAWGVAAKVSFALGDHARALDYARKAKDHRMIPNIEWIMVEGNAAKALGKIPEARDAWTSCTTLQGPAAALAMEAAKKLQQP